MSTIASSTARRAPVTSLVAYRSTSCGANAHVTCVVLGVLVGLLLAFSDAPVAHATDYPLVSSAESATHRLLALEQRYARARRGAHLRFAGALVKTAAERQALLSALIKDEPAEVLRNAVSAPIRAGLPPAARAKVEREVEEEGVLEVKVEDYAAGHRYRYMLRARGRRFGLHFAADPTRVPTGSRVRVRGVRVRRDIAVVSGHSVGEQSVAGILPNTFGMQLTAVILVNFQDAPTQPYTPAYAYNVVFGTTSDFFRENSFQQTWLTGSVFGWYTIPVNSTACNEAAIADAARAAATAAGVSLSGYTRLVYAFPQNACGWWGLGTVGGNPSSAWINGSFQLRVVGHEMGHNLGLFHSHSLDCGAAAMGSSCTASEYGDTVDIMGGSSAHFNAFQKERLGWLDYGVSPPLTTVRASGTYWIKPHEAASSSALALKIPKSVDPGTGAQTWYYAEYRRPIGFDGFLSTNANVSNGLLVHTGADATGNSSYLLDMTPDTTSWSDPALAVGRSFYDPDADVTLGVVSADSTVIAVAVAIGPAACVRGWPSVDVQLSGASNTFTVLITDTDSAGCPSSSYDLQAVLPSGWGASLASSTLSIAPGATASTTLQVTPPAGATMMQLQLTATNHAAATYAGATIAAHAVDASSM